ncbi:LysR substrate-binding domain-containing protein [Acuticoccus kandeliae]|uniref:LysR substrate-binding domain-containing protein n=1 Tax=Acuticoccus kandeliae TaxID=2073160 RepID=UPI000D3E1545|nr:LysR substrate-binding domain-containing protein [Acuticoccus kandeliae]
MDTKRLKFFVKMVETGSVSRAAASLNIAQPALSQQLSALERHFGQQLMVRSRQGIEPTQAGLALYRNAQIILRQLDRAEAEVGAAGRELTGSVSVGVSPYSAGSIVALPLLREIREQHPGIVAHVTESGHVMSELVMNGTLDMAVIHGAGPMHGLTHRSLLREQFCLVGLAEILPATSEEGVNVAELGELGLLLPPRRNFVRRAVDLAFTRASTRMTLLAEIESRTILGQALEAGLGATIVPWSVARQLSATRPLALCPVRRPTIEETVALCTSSERPLASAAQAVHDIILSLAEVMSASAASG